MPMIDVYGATGTFSDKHALAKDLAAAVMRWEKVPDLPLFRNNTAAFIHELPADSLSNVVGDSNYVRVQVLTPIGVLDRETNGHRRRGRRRPRPQRAHVGTAHRVTRGRLGDQRSRQHRRRPRSGRSRRPRRTKGVVVNRPLNGGSVK